jgi:hypothetical protein
MIFQCRVIACLLPGLAFAATGSFDVLTYNVAGLPAILNPNQGGDKVVNSRLIGSKLAQGAFDVAQLQEVRTTITMKFSIILNHQGLQLPCLYL